MGFRRWLVLALACSACASGAPRDRMAPGQVSLLVADRDADAVFRYDAATGEYQGLVTTGVAIGAERPSSVRLGPDGLLYVIGFERAAVARLRLEGGADAEIFFRDSSVLEEPVELLFRDDDVVVLGNDTRNAVMVGPDGVLASDFGYPDMRAAHDFLLAPDDLLYVGIDSHPAFGTSIQVWDPAVRGRVADFGQLDEIASATGLALGPDGLLYTCDSYRDQVLSFDPASGRLAALVVDGASGLLQGPVSLDFAPDGTLFVVDDLGVAVVDPHTGAVISRLLEVGDGHLVRPRNLMFLPAI